MNFRQRRFLFIATLIAFLIIGPLIVLYSQGYKFDFSKKAFVQTGGIFIKTYPPDSQLYVNNKLKTKTNFLTGTVLITNLLPRQYFIEIKKNGYLPWKKNLTVQEKKVTDAKNIYLIPNKIDFQKLKTGSNTSSDFVIKDFSISPDKSKMALYQNYQNRQIISVVDLDNDQLSNLWQTSTAENDQSQIKFLSWSADSKKIFFIKEPTKKTTSSCFMINIDNHKAKSFSENYYIFYLLGTEKNNKLLSEIKNSLCYKIDPHSVLILSKEGFLVRSDLNGTILQIYNLNPIKRNQNQSYKIISDNKNIFVKEGNSLYYLDQDNHIFKQISSSANLISIAPDSNKIAFSDGHDIWVFYLKADYNQPIRKAQESVFLTRFSKSISNLQWFNSSYIIFSVNNKIKISEIDNRDGLNIADINTPQFSHFFFNSKNKKLYILNKKGLYSSQPFSK